jgi:hypothetical protein
VRNGGPIGYGTRMPIRKQLQSPRFQSFHAIAALRGDGLHPEFVQLFERLAQGADVNLSDIVEAPSGFEPGATSQNDAPDEEPKKP